ncbi:unnamed protein product [Hermetia illucens]|uniref:Uncharacterized protein n=1 Tax=Hermetia illucens TaxID=343691 RepID=A0A7R8UJE4_HERIL|nr:unnamed protein product [Hermetia illucens]
MSGKGISECTPMFLAADETRFACEKKVPIIVSAERMCVTSIFAKIGNKGCRGSWASPWDGIIKMNTRNYWLFILRKVVAVTLLCSDGQGEDVTLSGMGVLVLGERCVLRADGFRLTSQDVVKKEVFIHTGQCCDVVQPLPEEIRELVRLNETRPLHVLGAEGLGERWRSEGRAVEELARRVKEEEFVRQHHRARLY